jgi:aminomethyltransferase
MYSPMLDKGIGMGYVETPLAKPGTAINICIRNSDVPATVVPVPFLPKG